MGRAFEENKTNSEVKGVVKNPFEARNTITEVPVSNPFAKMTSMVSKPKKSQHNSPPVRNTPVKDIDWYTPVVKSPKRANSDPATPRRDSLGSNGRAPTNVPSFIPLSQAKKNEN